MRIVQGFRRWFLKVMKAVLGDSYGKLKTFVFLRLSPRQAWRLARSGVFDREYYEAQCGLTFYSVRKARSHWLRHGTAKDVPPHPLIEPEFLPAPVRQNLRLGNLRAFLDYLSSRAGRRRAWSPCFDPRAVDGFAGPSYLRTLTPNSPLPVGEGWVGPVPTWGVLREQALAMARSLASEATLRREAYLSEWDTAAERR